MSRETTLSIKDVAIIAAGPIVAGACLGLGPHGTLATAIRIPVVFALVGVLMIPALYILTALLGIAPSLSTIFRATVAGFRSASVLFLGLAPAIAFMAATSSADHALLYLDQGVVVIGAGLALRELYIRAFADCGSHFKAASLYGVWAVVCFGIGAHLYVTRAVL